MVGTSGKPGFLIDGNIRLLLFGGKGGVGKTTASAATALEIALLHPEKSLLLVSTDPTHSLQDSLSGDQPPPNLKVLELDAQAYIHDFQEKNRQRLGEIASRGTFLDEEDINRFMELSLPGMDELMAFLEISRWIKEGAYDGIIMDTAPTGHTLRLMEMPDLIRKWLEALDTLLAKHRYMKKLFRGSYERDDLDRFIEGLAASVKQMEKLLKDHQQCLFVPVMLAEALSIEETLDLIRELQHLRIGVVDVVINRLFPESSCLTCRHIRAHQLRELARIFKEPGFSKLRFWGVPMYPEEIRGMESLRSFWEGLKEVAPAPVETSLSLPPVTPRVEGPPPLPSPDMEMLVFAGKGGVGKTILACATALHLAHTYTGKRILLFSADPAHSLADCLNMPLGPQPMQAALRTVEKPPPSSRRSDYEQCGETCQRYVLIKATISEDGQAHCAMVDITEQTRLKETLRQSEGKYRAFFDTSKDCAFITAPAGELLDMNDAGAELFGFERKEERTYERWRARRL